MLIFKDKISVIMPAHNEGSHIFDNIKETHDVFKKTKRDFEIILVDDGSSDNTYSEAMRATEIFNNLKVVKHNKNNGKGNALKDGFNYVTGEYVVFLDSDLDLHPHQLHRLFSIMRNEQAEVITGSKYHPDSKLNYPPHRKLISKIYAFTLKILFSLPIRDTQTGIKIFKHEVLKRVFPRVLCKRYVFDVELLANANRLGYKIAESPIVLDYRRRVKWGRIRLFDLYKAGLDTLAIFYRMHILRYYDDPEEKNSEQIHKDCKAIKQ